MNELARAEFIVKGFVHGVGFRYFVYRHAERLGLKGFAKNMYDGTVLVQVEGFRSSIEELKEQLHIGPSRARVDAVHTTFQNYKGEFTYFNIN
jgi:acylphosphatase